MADRRRIVTISETGTVATVLDVEDLTTFYSVKNSFTAVPGAPKPIQAERARRFGGWTKAGETHDNGSIAWTAQIKGTTADLAIANGEALFALLRDARGDLFFEWRPEGATASTFFEIRGPATMTPTYEWATFAQGRFWSTTVEIPVAPLSRGLPTSITLGTPTLPAVVALGTAVPGSAPSVADLLVRTGTGSGSAPAWALVAWTQRPGAPIASSVAPFGVIEAESGTLTTFAGTGADATFRGSAGITVTTAGAGTASALYALDPSTMVADDFAASDIDIEVWARVKLASTVVSPKLTLSLQPFAGLSFGFEQFAAEWGSQGKTLVLPSTSTAFKPTRLGTLSMPVDKVTPLKWNMKVAASWAAGSTGQFALDYLVLVPARARALSPTSKPLDSTFPKFIASNADTQKKIRGNDLSGTVGSAANNMGRDSGLGGSPIELPPGNVDVLIWLSSVVPDDPTVDTQTQQLSHALLSPSALNVIPRYYLAKGT